MNMKHIARDIMLIVACMGADLFAVYQYGINLNLRVVEAVFAGILVAALLNIPFYFFALYGWGRYLDTTEDVLRKKSQAKFFMVFSIVYALLIFSVIVTVRARQIIIDMAGPAYSNLFLDLLFTISPILTSIFSFVLGLKAAKPNIDELKKDLDKSETEFDQAQLALNKHNGETRNKAERVAGAFKLGKGFVEDILEKKELSEYIGIINLETYREAPDRHAEHLDKGHSAYRGMLIEICRQLDHHAQVKGTLLRAKPSEDLEREANLLRKVDESFKMRVNNLISDRTSPLRSKSSHLNDNIRCLA